MRSSGIDLWSRLMLLSTATRGRYSAIEPSLSSTSATNAGPLPTRALAKGVSASTKFFITAPFMIVGSPPAWVRIQPIIPVTVDLPLVPPTAIPTGAALNKAESSSARLIRAQPSSRARTTSGTVSSTAAEATSVWSAAEMPLPSCGWSAKPCRSSHANFSGVRPWSRLRSEPATLAPCPLRIIASGSIPEPPMPQKNQRCAVRSVGPVAISGAVCRCPA